MTLSVFGALLALVYAALAIFVVAQDRAPSRGGNWITLNGMSTFLVTLPVSGPCEQMGAKLDFRNNAHMAIAIGGCALLLYIVGAGLDLLVSGLFAR